MKFILFMFLGSAVLELVLKNVFPADKNTADPKAALKKLENEQSFHEAGLPQHGSGEEESYSYISSEPGPHGVQIHDVSEGTNLNVEE